MNITGLPRINVAPQEQPLNFSNGSTITFNGPELGVTTSSGRYGPAITFERSEDPNRLGQLKLDHSLLKEAGLTLYTSDAQGQWQRIETEAIFVPRVHQAFLLWSESCEHMSFAVDWNGNITRLVTIAKIKSDGLLQIGSRLDIEDSRHPLKDGRLAAHHFTINTNNGKVTILDPGVRNGSGVHVLSSHGFWNTLYSSVLHPRELPGVLFPSEALLYNGVRVALGEGIVLHCVGTRLAMYLMGFRHYAPKSPPPIQNTGQEIHYLGIPLVGFGDWLYHIAHPTLSGGLCEAGLAVGTGDVTFDKRIAPNTRVTSSSTAVYCYSLTYEGKPVSIYFRVHNGKLVTFQNVREAAQFFRNSMADARDATILFDGPHFSGAIDALPPSNPDATCFFEPHQQHYIPSPVVKGLAPVAQGHLKSEPTTPPPARRYERVMGALFEQATESLRAPRT